VFKKIKKHILPAFMVIGAVLSLNHEKFAAPVFYMAPDHLIENQAPLYVHEDASDGVTTSVHSATAVSLPNGNLLAMWYGGTREGHTDVNIYASVFDRQTQKWQPSKAILDRLQVADDLDRYIKKVGNPTLIRHPAGPLVLAYVTVSMAGWASSQVNMMVSYDDGQSWHTSKHLVTSPFLNISTLVKNDMVIYEDGSIGITAYHELIGQFSEIVRVTLDGQVINKYRISSGAETIQPSIAVHSKNNAVTYMRDTSKDVQKVRRSVTFDGGIIWSPYESTMLNNPNSSVFAFVDSKDRSWMVLNNAVKHVDHALDNGGHQSRGNLALAVSEDQGVNWNIVHYFEKAKEIKETGQESKYSYPWVTVGGKGEFNLFYTWNRKVIKHIRFNQAWLEEQV
jgi:predicted neuraminidase